MTEIVQHADDLDAGTLEVFPPAKPVTTNAVAMLQQHAQTMDAAFKLASNLVLTEMVPTRFRRKAEDATAAILYGAELGLSPIQALQNVFAVNGSPAIYARTMAALLTARGYQFRAPEKTAEAVTIEGWKPGRNPDVHEPDETARWTIADAERAGYTKNPKYDSDPRGMLYAKSLAEVCRHLAPDVLLGIAYSVEELEAEQQPAAPPRRSPARGLGGIQEAARKRAAAAEPEPVQEPLDVETETEPAAEPAAPEDKPEKTPRQKLNDACFALFGEVGLNGDAKREERLIVVRAILGNPDIQSTKQLTNEDLADLRDGLADRKADGSLDAQITDWINAADVAENES